MPIKIHHLCHLSIINVYILSAMVKSMLLLACAFELVICTEL